MSGERQIQLGVSPSLLKSAGRLAMPLQDEFPQGYQPYSGGVEIYNVNPAYTDPSFDPGQPQKTINPPIGTGAYAGFRVSPITAKADGTPIPFFSPRTLILTGLSTQQGGDGSQWVFKTSRSGWVPQAFSSIAFGIEQAYARATDSWEVWLGRSTEAMLAADSASPITGGYVRDPLTGLFVAPPIGPYPTKRLFLDNGPVANYMSGVKSLDPGYRSVQLWLQISNTAAGSINPRFGFQSPYDGQQVFSWTLPSLAASATQNYLFLWGPQVAAPYGNLFFPAGGLFTMPMGPFAQWQAFLQGVPSGGSIYVDCYEQGT